MARAATPVGESDISDIKADNAESAALSLVISRTCRAAGSARNGHPQWTSGRRRATGTLWTLMVCERLVLLLL